MCRIAAGLSQMRGDSEQDSSARSCIVIRQSGRLNDSGERPAGAKVIFTRNRGEGMP